MVDSTTLTVAFAPGVTVTKWTRIWAERHPQTPLIVLPIDEGQQVSVVLDGIANLSFVRLPIDSNRLHVIPLYRERLVVVAAKDHFLAAADAVTLADFAGEVQHAAGIKHHDRGPFDLVAAGVGVLVVPQSIARLQSRKDVVVRPVTDAQETQIALVWREDTEANATANSDAAGGESASAELIAEFIGIVRGRTSQSSRSALPDNGSPAQGQSGRKKAAAKGAGAAKSSSSKLSGASHAANRKRAEARKKHRGR